MNVKKTALYRKLRIPAKELVMKMQRKSVKRRGLMELRRIAHRRGGLGTMKQLMRYLCNRRLRHSDRM